MERRQAEKEAQTLANNFKRPAHVITRIDEETGRATFDATGWIPPQRRGDLPIAIIGTCYPDSSK